MPYKSFKAVEEQDLRIFMAGLTFTQYVGYRTPREFCKQTTLIVADLDTDEILFFSNTIDRDEKNALDNHTSRFSSYFGETIASFVRSDSQEAVFNFFSASNLRKSFQVGRMTDSLEYPCLLESGTMWIRGCYNIEQDEETGHLIVTVILIDVTNITVPE